MTTQLFFATPYREATATGVHCTQWAIKKSQLIFVCIFLKKQPILMQFTLLDFKWKIHVILIAWTTLLTYLGLMLIHHLVKVETPKVHVNTTSAFNVNYKIAVIYTKLQQVVSCKPGFRITVWVTVSMLLHSLMNHINEHSFQNMCSKCPPPARTCTQCHDLRRSVDNVLVKAKRSLQQAFSQIIDVMNHFFIHALLYNTQNK